MTMRLWCRPGVSFELGRLTVLIAPPGFLVDLLLQPEVDRYTTLYLYGVSSRVLHRLPRRAPRLEVQSCMTVHQLLASLREADQSIVIVEYDDGIFSSLEGEIRDVIFAVGRTLRELARSSAVLIWAPRGDRGLRALLRTADQIVWHFDERPARSMAPVYRRRRGGAGDAGRGGMSLPTAALTRMAGRRVPGAGVGSQRG